jgi:hypothetical protein
MSLSQRILKRLKTDFFKGLYFRNVSCVLETPPIKPGNLPFIALSMVHQRDVIAYLVAIKSFSRFANPERVVVICDPSIGDHEKAIFKSHIPHVELRNAEEFQDSRTPIGGTWERLSAITTYSPESYVVQLDADTVTLDSVPEVISAINNHTGFVIGEKIGQKILTSKDASYNASKSTSKHIQALSEQVISEVNLSKNLYVRGCSGFTGFPSNSMMRELFFEFSERMFGRIGDRWKEWGTEQVTSNYLVANSSNAVILPYPKYCTPSCDTGVSVFHHYIGEIRFTNRAYEHTSISVIKSLIANS